MQPKIVDILQL